MSLLRNASLFVLTVLACAIPLAALAAVLLFNAPILPAVVLAMIVLIPVAWQLLAAASGSSGSH